jgi:putative oxidoreductase
MPPVNTVWTDRALSLPINTVWAERALGLLRIMAGLLFLQHGLSKFFGFPGAPPAGFAFMSLGGLAGAIEIVGGVLVALGLYTRVAAFIMSGQMAVAYFMAHAPRGFFPYQSTGGNGGELAVLYCFIFLYLAAVGGGAWSLDRLREKS